MNEINSKKVCQMCGLKLPPSPRYNTELCWMHWREVWETGHARYYLKTLDKKTPFITYYEEVQNLRGVFAFDKKNKVLIKKRIEKDE